MSAIVLLCGNLLDGIFETLSGPMEILVQGNRITSVGRSVVASIALMFGGAAVGTLLLRHSLALPLAFAAFSSFSGALMVYGGRQPSGSEMLAKQGGTK